MRAGGDDRLGEPLLVVGVDEAGVHAAKDAAGAAIDRLRAVAVLEAVVDLAFVAVHELAGNAAKEDAAVEARGVADAFELQDEVAELLVRFDAAAAGAGDVQLAVLVHDELALALGMVLPAGQVLAVEDRLQAERLELDVFELDGARVELQADEPAADRGGIVVGRALLRR